MSRNCVTARIAAAGLLVLSACSTQPHIPPLNVKQAEAGEAIALDPALTLVSGRLGMVDDGKSMLPYYIGTHPGCVAAQVGLAILLLPLALLGPGPILVGGGGCTAAAPALVVLHLESRRGGLLAVTANGLFNAQVPAGTYLVPEIEDNALRIAATMVFQVPTPGQAYYLGDVELSFSGEQDKTRILSLEIGDNYVAGQAARLAAVPPAQAKGEQRALLARFTQYPGAAYFAGDRETADRKWNAYLDQVIAELAAKGIYLLGAAPAAMPLNDGVAAYERGDYATELRLWRPLAEQGNARAQFNLGILHALGQGVSRDDAEAATWYRRAAEQDFAQAQRSLASMYEHGAGIPQDNVQAYLWYELAARAYPAGADRDGAIAGRDRVATKMASDQVAKANMLVNAWMPGAEIH